MIGGMLHAEHEQILLQVDERLFELFHGLGTPHGEGKIVSPLKSSPQVQHSPLWTQPTVEKKSTIAVAQLDLPLLVLATLGSAIILGANRKPRGGQATF